jgi:methylaspartate ammonia-lyase
MQVIAERVTPELLGRSPAHFRPLAEEIDGIEISGEPLHSAIRYGVTQALLDAAAWCKRITMAEAVQETYGIEGGLRRVPIFCQSGSNWGSVDSMIMKSVPVIPHGLITNVEQHVGRRGEKLKEYVAWISQRVREVRTDPGYSPVIHIDVYGTIGRAFGEDIAKITRYLDELATAALPFGLRVEGPLDAGGREAQIEKLCELRGSLEKVGSSVGIVADEWCNTLDDIRAFADAKAANMIQVKTPDLGGIDKTVEALLYCRSAGVGAYSGGSANETDRSAQVTTHVAIACGASQCLAKPGLGVDEGLMIVNNEMSRVLALAGRPRRKPAS